MDAMRWMTGLTLGGVGLLGGCLQAKAHDCGNGMYCPANLVCVDAEPFCADPDELAACAGVVDDVECSTDLTPKGVCTAEACMPCKPEDLRCRYWTWTAMASPTTETLRGIWAAGPKDIYAVGDAGIVIHYDGVAWTKVATQFLTRTLYEIWGSGPSDIYVLGGTQVFHYTGAWPSAAEDLSTAAQIFAISGSSANHVVAVGAAGVIRRFTGASPWTGMPSSTAGTALYAAWGTSATDFYAAGDAVYHLDGAGWTVSTSLAGATGATINAMAGTSGGAVFAVGYEVPAGTFVPFAVKRAGTMWVPQAVPAGIGNEQLFGVWAAAADNAFAVGTGGLIVHHDGSSWEPTRLGTTLNAITGTSSGDVFAVGENGLIWRYSYAP